MADKGNSHQTLNIHKKRRTPSHTLIRMASVLSVAIALFLAGGFVYGAYAASGHTVGSRQKPAPSTISGTGSGTGASQGSASNGGIGTSQSGTSQGQSSGSGSQGAGGGKAAGSNTVRVVALGDSLTHGFGDTSGKGYVGDVIGHLKQQHYKVVQSNLGVDGLTSAGLLKQLKQPQVQQEIRKANLVLISIGGNDLNDAAGLPAIHTKKIQAAEKQFDANLGQIMSKLRKWNQKAPVLLVGLYNPYGDIQKIRNQTNRIVEQWNADELQITRKYADTVVVQTYDLFELNPAKFLYYDHFHPNQLGYERIAERLWQDIQGIPLAQK
ncbi:GDSL-type esterase/lipase family protein [Alicyclobacillus sp. SO9]|uniref:GDSL-type esterase/lipase family protein n=1 Tax=Alicyclobacillus sp. SO9 TaxID=2665646 RepID=UPI0018E86A9A|nr:GDSL-type esterase/lipase family protein [Alicyclobacillus sp. SO9]QQE79095.1 hypothetical protein GI364_00795 [Alicyclobacillus sp. SO9]